MWGGRPRPRRTPQVRLPRTGRRGRRPQAGGLPHHLQHPFSCASVARRAINIHFGLEERFRFTASLDAARGRISPPHEWIGSYALQRLPSGTRLLTRTLWNRFQETYVDIAAARPFTDSASPEPQQYSISRPGKQRSAKQAASSDSRVHCTR